MPQYSVPINGPNGPGTMTVNASSPAAAMENASQGGNYATGAAVQGGNQNLSGGGGGAPSTNVASPTIGASADMIKMGNAITSAANALASGNREAFERAKFEWDQTFGLEKDKFAEFIRQYNQNYAEGIRQYNQNYLISQAGLTGQFQGAPTLQAQQQQYSQQIGVLQAAQAAQTNPFRQAEITGQLQRILQGSGVPGFQAPGAATGQTDFSGMGNLQRMIDDIRGGPGSVNSQSVSGVLGAIPTPNKINSADFLRADPNTQSVILSGIQQKYGINPDVAIQQIRNTLPAFTAPATFGSVKG